MMEEQVERNRRIVAMYIEERTLGQIAALFGISRGSVSGVISRARNRGQFIPRREDSINKSLPKENLRSVTSSAQRKAEKKVREQSERLVIQAAAKPSERLPGVSMAALEVVQAIPCGCRYPHGNPGERGFHFCGSESLPGVSYCDRHYRATHLVAYGQAYAQAAE